jgi:hypothetical protein
MVIAEALEARPSSASTPKVAASFVVQRPEARRFELAHARCATVFAVDLLACG